MGRRVGLDNQKGVTLIETVVAIGLGGIIILAGAEGVFQLSKQTNKVRETTSRDISSRSFAQNFAKVFQSAAAAVNYEHLPIKTKDCTSLDPDPVEVPCLRELGSNNAFIPIPTSNFGAIGLQLGGADIDVIEFFRDESPRLTEIDAWDTSTKAKLRRSPPLALTSVASSGPYYTTWPLADETSPPLTVLRSSSLGYTFKLRGAYSSPPASNPYTFFMASRALDAGEQAALNGSLILLYNGFTPTHHAVQVVASDSGAGVGVMDCFPPEPGGSPAYTSACDADIYWLSTPAEKQDLYAKWATAGEHWYALPLKALTTSARFGTHYVPSLASLGISTGTACMGWGGSVVADQNGACAATAMTKHYDVAQPTAFYLFPTAISSIRDVSSDDFSATDPLDLRKLAHFYHTKLKFGPQDVLGVPLSVNAYYLNKHPLWSSTKPKYNFVMSTYQYQATSESSALPRGTYKPDGSQALGDSEVALITEFEGKVVLARRLTTPTFGAFIYDKQVTAPSPSPSVKADSPTRFASRPRRDRYVGYMDLGGWTADASEAAVWARGKP